MAGARSICLDVCRVDTTGKKYGMEFQREDKEADPYWARHHSSVLATDKLGAGGVQTDAGNLHNFHNREGRL